jgi:hypothetical protein
MTREPLVVTEAANVASIRLHGFPLRGRYLRDQASMWLTTKPSAARSRAMIRCHVDQRTRCGFVHVFATP